MKKVIFLLLLSVTILSGCADFTDTPGKSVWSEGLWVLPWLTGIASLIYSVRFYFQYKRFKGYTGKKKLQYGSLVFAVAFLLATAVIIFSVINNR